MAQKVFWLLSAVPQTPVNLETVLAVKIDVPSLLAVPLGAPSDTGLPGLFWSRFYAICQYDRSAEPFDVRALALVEDGESPILISVASFAAGPFHVAGGFITRLSASFLTKGPE